MLGHEAPHVGLEFAVAVSQGGLDLAADITVQSAAELDLAPGSDVTFVAKASEVAVHRTSGVAPR